MHPNPEVYLSNWEPVTIADWTLRPRAPRYRNPRTENLEASLGPRSRSRLDVSGDDQPQVSGFGVKAPEGRIPHMSPFYLCDPRTFLLTGNWNLSDEGSPGNAPVALPEMAPPHCTPGFLDGRGTAEQP